MEGLLRMELAVVAACWGGALRWCAGARAGISDRQIHTLAPCSTRPGFKCRRSKNGEAHLVWKGCCG